MIRAMFGSRWPSVPPRRSALARRGLGLPAALAILLAAPVSAQTPATLPETMTLDNVKSFLAANDVATVEAFVAALPPLHKRHFVAVHGSAGPEKGFISGTHPRIVSWGADSRFIASWTTHPQSPTREHVEFLQAAPSLGKWLAGVIDFSADPVEITQPASCAGCHTSMNRPLWGGSIHTRGKTEKFHGAEGDGSSGSDAAQTTMKESTDPRIAALDFTVQSRNGKPFRKIAVGRTRSHPVWDFPRTLMLRHAEVVYGNLMLRPDADRVRARILCQAPPPEPLDFSQSPALWDPRLFPDARTAVQGWKASDLVHVYRGRVWAVSPYRGGLGSLDHAVRFLAAHDAYQRLPAVRALYESVTNRDAFFPKGRADYNLHHPAGGATAAQELLASYKEFFGTSGQAYLDQRLRRTHGGDRNFSYSEGILPGAFLRRRVCGALDIDLKPSAPSALSATVGVVDGRPGVTLTWTDNSSDEHRFLVRFRKSGAAAWTDGPSAAPDATTATVAALAFSADYEFLVGAENRYGIAWSGTASVTTPAAPPSGPRRLTVARTAALDGSHRAQLNWSAPSFVVTGLEVEARETAADASWTVTKQVGADVRSAVLTGLDASKRHAFRVVAADANRRIAGVETLPPPVPVIAGGPVNENEAWTVTPSLPGGGSDGLAWSLANGDAAAFGIDEDDGAVTMSAKDHEDPEDGDENNLYDVAVTVTDRSGASAARWIRVQVTDVNEAPAFEESAALEIEIPEGATGAFGSPVTAVDPEGGTVTYSLSGGDASSFEIDAATARLAVGKDTDLDLETRASHRFDVVATDAGSPGLSASRAVTVTLTNVNEAPEFASSATLAIEVPEGTTGAFGAPVVAVDPDGDALTYSLSGADASSFEIDASTAQLAVGEDTDLNFEARTSYAFNVAAADAGGLSASRSVTLNLTDLDEAITITGLPNGRTPEGRPYASPTPRVAGARGALVWTLEGPDADRLAVAGATGVLSMPARDHEAPEDADGNNVYEATLRVTDADGVRGATPFSVTVTNVNEAPEFASSAALAIDVPEGTTGAFGAPVVAVDPDGDALTYSLSGADASSFEIDASTAQLAVGEDTDLNFEARTSYAFNVTAADSGALSASRSVTVTVTDLDEAITITGLPNGRTPEGRPYVSPTPRVAGARGALVWTLEGPDADRITVARATGVLSMPARDHEAPEDADGNNVYEVTLRVTDADGVRGATPFSVTVTNVNEASDAAGGSGTPGGGGGAPATPTPPEPDPPAPPGTDPLAPSATPLTARFLPDCSEEGACRAAVGENVLFEDMSEGRATGRRWDFGDGANSARRVVSHAWSAPGFFTVTLEMTNGRDASSESRTFLVESASPRGTCEPDAFTRCLGHSRFAVQVDWWTVDQSGTGGQSGRARVVEVGGDESSLFSFFGDGNWELLVKVLDGCAVNESFWVFGAAATDIGYRIAVTDTRASRVMEYENRPGSEARALSDTTAFRGACEPN